LLLTKHRTPDGIRRTGQARLQAWLKKQGTRSSAAVAQAAVDAAKSQHTTVPAQLLGELIVAALAQEILTLNEELAELDALISEKVTEHRHTQSLLSMPGFGPVLAAEFLGATGGDLTVFETADRFAGVAGLAPAPRDSGRITGNHHRPRRYDRRLLRVFYLSGLSALKSCPASRAYYDRKRADGKAHIQAMLSLARRRLNVLWAMLRDGTTYTPAPVPARPRLTEGSGCQASSVCVMRPRSRFRAPASTRVGKKVRIRPAFSTSYWSATTLAIRGRGTSG